MKKYGCDLVWKDSRLESPSSNAFDRYVVVFKLLDGIDHLGFADWQPNDGYKTGKWNNTTSTNGNPHGDLEVLYWLPHPSKPRLI